MLSLHMLLLARGDHVAPGVATRDALHKDTAALEGAEQIIGCEISRAPADELLQAHLVEVSDLAEREAPLRTAHLLAYCLDGQELQRPAEVVTSSVTEGARAARAAPQGLGSLLASLILLSCRGVAASGTVGPGPEAVVGSSSPPESLKASGSGSGRLPSAPARRSPHPQR